jgi:hypothetical protein
MRVGELPGNKDEDAAPVVFLGLLARVMSAGIARAGIVPLSVRP